MLIGIIPCAGKGSRLSVSAQGVAKPLVQVAEMPLVAYSMALMKDMAVSSVVLIISSSTEAVRERFGNDYHGLPIEYIVQEPRGLLHAVYQARDFVTDRFVTLLSDEIYAGSRHRDLISYWRSHPDVDGLVGYIAGQRWEAIAKNYSMVLEGGAVKELVEKPYRQVNDLLGTGTWALTRRFFGYASAVLAQNPLDKRSFVDALQLMIDDGCSIQGYELHGSYVNVNCPLDVQRAEALAKELCHQSSGVVAPFSRSSCS